VPAFVTTLMLAAEARGLGTIWLGWPLGRPEIVRETLAIPEEEQLGAFVALGFPDRTAPVNLARSPRDAVSTFTRWMGWD
jgi:nitroreductase